MAGNFVGRAGELAALDLALRRSRLVTLTGSGGAGKTRLALELVRRRERRASPVVVIDLSEETADHVADAVRGITVASGLAVVDNCEHVIDAAARAIAALLDERPRLRVLATSREALRLPAERVLAVGPLDAADAERLFEARAGAVRPGALAGGREPVRAICARLEGFPLAVELAAARVAALSPATILARLDEQLDLLAGDARGVPDRHRSLRATIRWSFELLTRAEQAAFARLSVFAGGFSLAAAGTVTGVGLDALASLVAKSLVTVAPHGDELRYRLLDTLRAYAREQLTGADEAALRDRHLRYLTDVAEAVHDPGSLAGSQTDALTLAVEIANLRAALAWSVDRDPALGLRLLGATRGVWFLRGQTEGGAWAARLLALHPAPDRARSLGLLVAGHMAVAHQRHAEAKERLGECAALARRLDDAGVEAAARHYLGVSAMLARDLDAADRELARSLDLFEALDGAQGVGRGLGISGVVRFLRRDLPGARATLDRARARLEACGDTWGQGQARVFLGLTARDEGDAAGARDHLSAAVRLLGGIGDATLLGVGLAALATLTAGEDPSRAARLAGAAVGARERIGGHFPPGTVAELDAVKQVCAAALGDGAAERAWAAGRELTAQGLSELTAGHRRAVAAPGRLTVRQLEIARLVADGQTNAQIARVLHLSERTVENHVQQARSRLGLQNRVQLATWMAAQVP